MNRIIKESKERNRKLHKLGLLTEEQYSESMQLTAKNTDIVKLELAKRTDLETDEEISRFNEQAIETLELENSAAMENAMEECAKVKLDKFKCS